MCEGVDKGFAKRHRETRHLVPHAPRAAQPIRILQGALAREHAKLAEWDEVGGLETRRERWRSGAAAAAPGALAGAASLARAVREAQARTLGAEHADALRTKHNLAITLQRRGDLAGAEALSSRGGASGSAARSRLIRTIGPAESAGGALAAAARCKWRRFTSRKS